MIVCAAAILQLSIVVRCSKQIAGSIGDCTNHFKEYRFFDSRLLKSSAGCSWYSIVNEVFEQTSCSQTQTKCSLMYVVDFSVVLPKFRVCVRLLYCSCRFFDIGCEKSSAGSKWYRHSKRISGSIGECTDHFKGYRFFNSHFVKSSAGCMWYSIVGSPSQNTSAGWRWYGMKAVR